LLVSADNAYTNGEAFPTFAVTDSLGNTWTERDAALYDPGAASDGVAGKIFTTPMSGGTIVTGTVITVSFGSTIVLVKIWALYEIVPGAGGVAVYSQSGHGSGSRTDVPTITTATLATDELVIGVLHDEYGTDTFTNDTDTVRGTWSTAVRAASGGTTTGLAQNSQWKTVTASGTQTYNLTIAGGASDCVMAWISFTEYLIQALTAVGAIASAEAFGTVAVTPGAVALTAVGAIASAEAFGTVAVTPGAVALTAVGAIASAEAFGTVVVALTGTALVGSSDGAASAAAALTAQIRLAGTSAGVGASSAALTAQIRLAGTSAGVGAGVAALTTLHPLEGTAAGAASSSAALTAQIRLAGTSAGISTTSARFAWPFPVAVPSPPFEVDIFDGAALTTMLATLEGARGRAFTDLFNEVGSGVFLLSVADPKATAAILTSGNLVKVRIGGTHRFAYWIENPKKLAASPSGEAGEFWSIGGRGAVAMLERAIVYPPGWPTPSGTTHSFAAVPAGSILRTFILAAQARGALTGLTITWTATHDSNAVPWTDSISLEVKAGTNLLALWNQLVAMGYEFHMSSGLALSMYPSRSTDRTTTVILRAGKHLREGVERNVQDAGLRTRVLVEGAGGLYGEVAEAGWETGAIGRREGFVSFGGTTSPSTLTRVGQATLDILEAARGATVLPVHHGSGAGEYEPYADYALGDWIALDVEGTFASEAVRVAGITGRDRPGGYQVDLDLNSVALEAEVRLKRMLDAMALVKVTSGDIAPGAVDDAALGDGSWILDSGLAVPRIVSSLPSPVWAQGLLVFLTTDNKLYRSTGSAWTVAIPTVDLSGQITGTQITDDAISTAKIAANAVTAAEIAANTITADQIAANTITAGQIAAATITADLIAAHTLTGDQIYVLSYIKSANFEATNAFFYMWPDDSFVGQYGVTHNYTRGWYFAAVGEFYYGLAVPYVTGAATDENANDGMGLNGSLAVDSGGKIYFRRGGSWSHCTMDGGFEIPAHETVCPVCELPLLPGQDMIGRGDRLRPDGSLHGLYIHLSCAGTPMRQAVADDYDAVATHGDLDDDPAAKAKYTKHVDKMTRKARKAQGLDETPIAPPAPKMRARGDPVKAQADARAAAQARR
jgi:hypothetical protein